MTPEEMNDTVITLQANFDSYVKRQDEHHKKEEGYLRKIHDQVKKTNGRVTKLEQAKKVEDAIQKERMRNIIVGFIAIGSLTGVPFFAEVVPKIISFFL